MQNLMKQYQVTGVADLLPWLVAKPLQSQLREVAVALENLKAGRCASRFQGTSLDTL